MNGGWIPVLIVAMVMIMIVMKARYRSMERRGSSGVPEVNAETARLEEEVRQLKDRIRVLERIAVEKENSLSREIDQLRDQ